MIIFAIFAILIIVFQKKMSKRLTKGDEFDSMLSGVCSGLSEYFNVDVTLIRFAWVILSWFYGVSIIIYFILAIIMPNKWEK